MSDSLLSLLASSPLASASSSFQITRDASGNITDFVHAPYESNYSAEDDIPHFYYPRVRNLVKTGFNINPMPDSWFKPYVEGDDACCVNSDFCHFNDGYEGEKIMFIPAQTCSCCLRYCKACFTHDMQTRFGNTVANAKCLTNSHKGSSFLDMTPKRTLVKKTLISEESIVQFAYAWTIKRHMEANAEFYYANIHERHFDGNVPNWILLYNAVADVILNAILSWGSGEDVDDVHNCFYLCERGDALKPVMLNAGGYEWNDDPHYDYADVCVIAFVKGKFTRLEINFKRKNEIVDMAIEEFTENPQNYMAIDMFSLLKDEYQTVLGNHECDIFRSMMNNEDRDESGFRLFRHMIDDAKLHEFAENEASEGFNYDLTEVFGSDFYDTIPDIGQNQTMGRESDMYYALVYIHDECRFRFN